MKQPREKPLGLDMPFDEALRRFIGVDPAELPDRKKEGRPKATPSVDDKPAEEAGDKTRRLD
jgi:hypothetical protein